MKKAKVIENNSGHIFKRDEVVSFIGFEDVTGYATFISEDGLLIQSLLDEDFEWVN